MLLMIVVYYVELDCVVQYDLVGQLVNEACLKSAIDLHLLDAEWQNDALICKKQGASKLVLRKHP